jgi:hypothetical protein
MTDPSKQPRGGWTAGPGYLNDFADAGYGRANAETWQRVMEEFSATEPEPDEVLLADYATGNYEGSAAVLYRRGDDYFYAEGSHCSCFGLEGQWEPTRYDLATLTAAVERVAGESYQSMYSTFGGHARELLPVLRARSPSL